MYGIVSWLRSPFVLLHPTARELLSTEYVWMAAREGAARLRSCKLSTLLRNSKAKEWRRAELGKTLALNQPRCKQEANSLHVSVHLKRT
ncbi:hypothetical protein GRJ2_001408200 [Grus japonensis]|uniref:Uncharacterized protein n=1 Tax=Grus japonensis TaxID=30415 RepID=A0ABC9WXA3_GRUJA